MSYDKRKLKRDQGNSIIPQYWNEKVQDFEVSQGEAGGIRTISTVLVAREPFNDNKNLSKEFTQEMSGLFLSNDGNTTITVVIGNDSYLVYAGETFDEVFEPFNRVTIISPDVPFRAWGRAAVLQVPIEALDSAPNNVTNLSAYGIGSTTLTLSWTPPTSVDTIGYDLFRGSSFIGTTSSALFDVVGLTPATQYTFTVKSKDAGNNTSTGTQVTVNTLA